MKEKILQFAKTYKKELCIVAVTAIAAVAITLFFVKKDWSSGVGVSVSGTEIDNTPQVVQKIKQIGEWEFLSVTSEELVDTTASNKVIGIKIGKDKQLVRVYTGTLRFGIDTKEMAEQAFEVVDDTLVVTLPEIKLLDEDFIDEAKTVAFYENGNWSDHDRQQLYEKAVRQMKENNITPANLSKARSNAIEQMNVMLKALGAKRYKVK